MKTNKMTRRRSSSKKRKTTNYRYSAEIIIAKDKGRDYKAILGESKTYKRGAMSISETGRELKISIKADDATALRASINMVLRDMQVINSVEKL